MTLITDSCSKFHIFFLIFGTFLFLQRVIHLIYKERRWYHFLYNPSTLCLDPYLSELVFELTDGINLYTYHGVMRRIVKYYRFIHVYAVLMSLYTMVMSRYCYIYLVAYFILRLLCVAFYWPHAWCRCACVPYGALMLLYPLVAVATLSFYMHCIVWPLLPLMGIGMYFVLMLTFLALIVIFSYLAAFDFAGELKKRNLPPFGHRQCSD